MWLLAIITGNSTTCCSICYGNRVKNVKVVMQHVFGRRCTRFALKAGDPKIFAEGTLMNWNLRAKTAAPPCLGEKEQ